MDVMDVLDAGHGRERSRGDGGALDAGGRAFEQDMGGVAHELAGIAEDQHGDEDREDRIDRHPAGPEDHERGRDGRDRAEEIADDMQERAAQVEVVLVAAMEDEEARDVDDEPADGDDEHRAAQHLDRLGDAPDRLVEDDAGDARRGRGRWNRRRGSGSARSRSSAADPPAAATGGSRRPRARGPAKSMNMCPASASSASEPENSPPAISASMNVPVSTAAMRMRRSLAWPAWSWSWPPMVVMAGVVVMGHARRSHSVDLFDSDRAVNSSRHPKTPVGGNEDSQCRRGKRVAMWMASGTLPPSCALNLRAGRETRRDRPERSSESSSDCEQVFVDAESSRDRYCAYRGRPELPPRSVRS